MAFTGCKGNIFSAWRTLHNKIMKISKQLTIYDWDGTIQSFKCSSSIGMILKTMFTKVDKNIIAHVIGDPNCVICTSRSKLYTWFIRLKCFMIHPSKIWFDTVKISTVHPYIFYDPEIRPELLGDDKEDSLKAMAMIKMNYVEGMFQYVKHTIFEHTRYYDNDLPDSFIDYDHTVLKELCRNLENFMERRKNGQRREI